LGILLAFGQVKMAVRMGEKSQRIFGYDVARAVAILGMVIVHFSLVMSADQTSPAWLATVNGFLDGRAAATFMVLAGIGITLMTRRAAESGDTAAVTKARMTLVRRGLFLLVLGFINLTMWPGDILRVYGVSMFVASRMFMATNRNLLVWASFFVLAFVVVFAMVDFEQNWNWETLEYRGLWTPVGVVRNLIYDGFRSVLPWTGFILFGMWLGRVDLRNRQVNNRTLFAAVVITVAAELVSWLCLRYTGGHPDIMSRDEAMALFGTQSMPALPIFMLAAGGTAVAVIAFCVRIVGDPPRFIWQPLIATGQMALTWYFAHIVLGLGTVVSLGLESTASLEVAAATGLAFFVGAAVISWGWKSLFQHGPLEWVMRRVAG
jgi:uncharacterized protein